jgi:deoxyinosine 3'endonuclease (endonuclease V)
MLVQETWYHPIAEDDMNVIMEYNCDYRRYTQRNYVQMIGNKPRFYKSAASADQNFSTTGDKALVVVKVVSTHISYDDVCSKDWDTEYYPEYIVLLHN